MIFDYFLLPQPPKSSRKRHMISHWKFNPAFHSPAFTTLPLHLYLHQNYRKEGKPQHMEFRGPKIVRAATPIPTSAGLSSDVEDNQIQGFTKFRGVNARYPWIKTVGDEPIQGPGPLPEQKEPGLIRYHEFKGGMQVWVLDKVSGGNGLYQWTTPKHGDPHPTVTSHFLQFDGQRPPTWVTQSTITTYASRRRQAVEESRRTRSVSIGDIEVDMDHDVDDDGARITPPPGRSRVVRFRSASVLR
ncbi:hypothetical protein FRB99_007498 [Tulasnella sp. 403]|nr:hypothetical protein FRB99_007498 [Tulasnella sp. 403]